MREALSADVIAEWLLVVVPPSLGGLVTMVRACHPIVALIVPKRTYKLIAPGATSCGRGSCGGPRIVQIDTVELLSLLPLLRTSPKSHQPLQSPA